VQAHEERAEEILRDMGGALSLPMQQTVLRRMILAEEAVVEYQEEVTRLNQTIARLRAELERLRAEMCQNCGIRHAPDDTEHCIEGHGLP
jgi:uncharacterized small protein (DUF1192 family)